MISGCGRQKSSPQSYEGSTGISGVLWGGGCGGSCIPSAVLELMMNGPQSQIILQFFEGLLNLAQAHDHFPQLRGVLVGEVGSE